MILKLVENSLLVDNKIYRENIYSLLSDLSHRKLDYSDLYFQSKYYENWVLEDGLVKESKYDFDQGVGVRSIKGESISFSYSNEINIKSLRQQVNIVNGKSVENTFIKSKNINPINVPSIYSAINPLSNFTTEDKINLLHTTDSFTRKLNKDITKVNISLTGMYEFVLIASTDGNFAVDIRPLVRLFISTLIEKDGKSEIGVSGGGGRYDYSFFLKKNEFNDINLEYFSKESVRLALVNLSTKEAPSGMMPVVLGNGWPGVLLHEAVGHGLEGDFNRRKTSVFSNKIGNQVTSPLCTIVDSGNLKNHRGSLTIDDEGVITRNNTLIKNGVLIGYLQDKFNAKLMNTVSTGNARRESYAYLPIPRMTNTYMLPGKSDPKDIIRSVEYGIFAPNFSGGQVDITSGNFVFSTSETYLIKNGNIQYPVKSVMLIGSGIEIMKSVSMVGNDLRMDTGVGICVKDGQSIPVGVGQPTIKIEKMTVGGTK